MTPTDIMIDLETGDTEHTAQIFTIAAVPFNLPEHVTHSELFYERIDINQYIVRNLYQFTRSKSTMDFHYSLPTETQVDNLGGIQELSLALHSLSEYLKRFSSVRVWGNAASFDISILEHAYKVFDMPIPWNFRNVMCYRTLKNLFPQHKQPTPHIPHNALCDATTQARHAEFLLAQISSLG